MSTLVEKREAMKAKGEFAIWLREDGASNAEIAEILETSQNSVVNIFTEMRKSGARVPRSHRGRPPRWESRS